MESKKSCCAVVSLYYPDVSTLERLLDSVCDVLDFVYLIDNSDSFFSYESLCFDNIQVVRQVNSGMTGALNRGIKESKFAYDYYLFLDQDSFFEKTVLEKYISRAVINNMKISAPVVFSYDNESVHSGFLSKFDLDKKSNYISVDRTQLSGLFVSADCLESVGLFNEDYFLNLGDTEWCLRACKAGFQILVHKDIRIFHQYAEGCKKVFFYKFHVSEPFRLYYRSRDSLRLIFNGSPFNIKIKLFFALFVTPFEIMLTDRKMDRLSYFLKGFLGYLKREKGIFKE